MIDVPPFLPTQPQSGAESLPPPMSAPLSPLEQPPPPPPVGDPTLVEKKVLEFSEFNAVFALQRTKDFISQRIATCDQAYCGKQKMTVPSEAGADLNYKLDIPELPDQVDDATAIDVDLLLGGELYAAIAQNGESQESVDITKDVVDAELENKNYKSEVYDLAFRFEKYPYTCWKAECSCETVQSSNRYEIPGEQYSDQMLQQNGFLLPGMSPDVAFNAALKFDGHQKFIGMNQPEPPPPPPPGQSNPMMPQPPAPLPSLLMQEDVNKEIYCYYPRAVHPRRMTFSDFNRKIQQQYSAHEYHYLTKNELKSWKGVQNIDKIGDPNGGGRCSPDGTQAPTSQNPNGGISQVNKNFEAYEVTETWQQIPYMEWMASGDYQQQDLDAYASMYGLKSEELIKNGLDYFRVFHIENRCILKSEVNYLMNRTENPYEVESAISGDDKLVGQAIVERLADPATAFYIFVNLLADNARMRLYQPTVFASRANIDQDKFYKDLFKPNGRLKVDGNMPLTDMIQFLEVPDNTNTAMSAIEFFGGQIHDKGTPPSLTGEARDRTATQTNINQQRGQTRVNSKIRRLHENVIIPTLRKIWQMVVMNFTESRYVEVAGSDGTQIDQRKWIQPKDVTDKVKIVAPNTFDYGQMQIEAQLLISLCNVFMPMMPPQQASQIMRLILQKSRIPRHEINDIMNPPGSPEQIMKDIKAMADDPNFNPQVKMEDNHQLCLSYGGIMAQQFLETGGQLGINQQQPNFDSWMQQHQVLAQQQMDMMMAQMPPQGVGGPQSPNGNGAPKGPPQQVPPPDQQPNDAAGMARRTGQAHGPSDNGVRTNSGLTGRAAPPRPVPGPPAGV